MSIRAVKRMVQSQATMEGAGVRLQRAFGFGDTSDFDPFLLLDDFRNEKPEDYLAGFPWHPHRGIETITYVLAGTVEHGDSLGNRGTLGGGDVQWMTAGSGILHQEMPKGEPRGRMHGFQLWANLPSSLKMTSPRYQDVQARNIPEVVDDDGTRIRVICGLFGADWAGRRCRGRPQVSRRVGAAWRHQAAPGRASPPRLRLCVRRFRPIPRRVGTAARRNRAGWPRRDDKRRDGRKPGARAFRRRRRDRRAGRRPGHPLSPGLWHADPGTSGLAWPDRDEHAGTAATSLYRAPPGRLHQVGQAAAPAVRPCHMGRVSWNLQIQDWRLT